MFNNNLCVSCEKPIDPDMDSHAECNKCNHLMCNDTNSCIRNHLEYDHGCGYTNHHPIIERRRVREKFKGITPSFVLMEDKIE